MGGDGHHHGPPKLPDYKIYRVEDIPELVRVQKALAVKGLKDPWLRNEVWKYDVKNRGTPLHIFRKTAGRGMGIGFGLAVVTTIIGYALESKDEHGAHH